MTSKIKRKLLFDLDKESFKSVEKIIKDNDIESMKEMIEETLSTKMFIIASIYGTVEMFKIFEELIDINFMNNKGESLFHHACYHGNMEIVEYLIEKHSWDINQIGSQGTTPLFYASSKDEAIGVFKLLLEKGAVTEHIADNGLTIYEHCLINSKLEWLKLLDEKRSIDLHKQRYIHIMNMEHSCHCFPKIRDDVKAYIRRKIFKRKYRTVDNKSSKCCICLEDFKKGEECCRCVNGHSVHQKCHLNYISSKKDIFEATFCDRCPTCRGDMVAGGFRY